MPQALPLIEQCPSCSGALEIRELHCPRCDLQLRGHFSPAAGAKRPSLDLTPEQLAFLRLFVASRGNLSDVERSQDVAYPTVPAKLDDLIAAVTGPAEPAAPRAASSG